MSSLQPKVGKKFDQIEIEEKKNKILMETRKRLIMLAIKDKEIEITRCSEEFERRKQHYTERNKTLIDFSGS